MRRVLLIVLALVVAASSCGLPRDEAPRAINNIPDGLQLGQRPTATPVLPVGDGTIGDQQIYMLSARDQLVRVLRPVAETPSEALQILLGGPTSEEIGRGVGTAITRGTRIQDVSVNPLFLLATVDLAPGSLESGGNNVQKLAFAQIVFTLTSFDNIESVEFVQTNPEQPELGAIKVPVQYDSGTTVPGQRVTREDYALLNIEGFTTDGRAPSISFDEFPTPVPAPNPASTPDPNAAVLARLPIWKLNESDQLVQVWRDLERTQDALIVGLFSGADLAERDAGIRSAIPPDALANPGMPDQYEIRTFDEETESEVIEVVNIATVDFAQGSVPPVEAGNERLLAAAQIVYTLTGLSEIDEVTFTVEGVPLIMPTQNGFSEPFDAANPRGLRRSDYDSLLPPIPTPTPDPSPVADPDAADATLPTPIPLPAPTLTPEPTLTPASVD